MNSAHSAEDFQGEDRLHRAFIDAQSAIDARVRINIEHFRGSEIGFILGGVNAINRADGTQAVSFVPMHG